jgi:hypothetical protein
MIAVTVMIVIIIKNLKVKQPHYRPEVAQKIPGS